jgi:hypothetical protein
VKENGAKWDPDAGLWYVCNPISWKLCQEHLVSEEYPFEDRDWRFYKFEDVEAAKSIKCRYSPEAQAWWKPSLDERRQYAENMEKNNQIEKEIERQNSD